MRALANAQPTVPREFHNALKMDCGVELSIVPVIRGWAWERGGGGRGFFSLSGAGLEYGVECEIDRDSRVQPTAKNGCRQRPLALRRDPLLCTRTSTSSSLVDRIYHAAREDRPPILPFRNTARPF